MIVGIALGNELGKQLGATVGVILGTTDGFKVGTMLGTEVGDVGVLLGANGKHFELPIELVRSGGQGKHTVAPIVFVYVPASHSKQSPSTDAY
jgi:hypothetical protein